MGWAGAETTQWSLVQWNRRVHFPELAELLDSGCPACEMFSNGIRWHMSQPQTGLDADMAAWEGELLLEVVTVKMNTEVNFQLSAYENGPYQLHLNVWYGEDRFCILTIPFYIYGSPNSHIVSKRIRGRVPSLNSLSPSNTTAMKTYLKNCSKNHTICQSKQDGELPSRLIAVETGCKGVRLVTTDGLPTGTRYATLSHVWGNPRSTPPFLVTTRENVSFMMELIHYESLPQTFQDAVAVTRALELRYVWIDSLCIVQDNPEDWLHEAPRMAKIYSNSYVTIVATSATSAHDGFLKRTEPYALPARIPYCIPSEGSVEAGFCYMQIKYSSFMYHEPTMELEEASWNTRGWTFQERILSRRLIHFTKSLVFIECWSGDWAEDNRVPGDLLINRMPWLGGRTNSGQSSEDPEEVLRSWYWILETYTHRFLTMEQDKLVALAGVIERISEITGFTNIAGLWREDFADGLLWCMPSDDLRRRRLEHPQGPSWSWASWDGPIFWRCNFSSTDAERKTWCFEILHIEPVQSPFVPDTGHLRVRGPLLRVNRSTLSTKTCKASLDIEHDGSGPPPIDTVHEAIDQDIVAFPVLHYTTGNTGTYELLLLSPVDGREQQFRRIGLLTASEEDACPGPLEFFLGGPSNLPSDVEQRRLHDHLNPTRHSGGFAGVPASIWLEKQISTPRKAYCPRPS
ncbi:HET-domain-containing protein [Apiospora rasikravindrae]|uniref:HET-domain-containing protein n=1 Tax=Apiospora rasikravindrae TaxID=990691 RepID=A0ABR1TF46_9PEZI